MKYYSNNKGFSMVELLAVLTIIGILSGVAVAGYTRYRERATNDNYRMMSDNAAIAAEEYFMKNRYESSVTFQKLVDEGYFERPVNPKNKEKTCYGIVTNLTPATTSGSISVPKYKVEIDCKKQMNDPDGAATGIVGGFTGCYNYPEKTKC